MPGGQLPWDIDVDTHIFGTQFDEAHEKVMPEMKKNYNLEMGWIVSKQTMNEFGELEGGILVYKDAESGYTLDNFAKAPSDLQCGKQAIKNRAPTLAKIDGVWALAPDNPARYARKYGNEILRHVPWVKSAKTAYDSIPARFKLCTGEPSHACLDNYSTDGNMQFRDDTFRLMHKL